MRIFVVVVGVICVSSMKGYTTKQQLGVFVGYEMEGRIVCKQRNCTSLFRDEMLRILLILPVLAVFRSSGLLILSVLSIRTPE